MDDEERFKAIARAAQNIVAQLQDLEQCLHKGVEPSTIDISYLIYSVGFIEGMCNAVKDED